MSCCVLSSQTIVEGSDRVSQKGVKPVSPVVTQPTTPGLQIASTPPPSTLTPVTVAQGPGVTTHGPVKEAELEKEKTHKNLKPGVKDGINVREEYGYIVTNQRYLITQTHFSSFMEIFMCFSAWCVLNKAGF